MATVTPTAKQKLKAKLQELKTDTEMIIRLIPSPSNPGQLEMVLDKEREGDQVVESDDGTKVLLIGADLVPTLEGMVIDFRETVQGAGFAISKSDPGQ
jgi:Fe-S cluster assembly iron-binding protein IscA